MYNNLLTIEELNKILANSLLETNFIFLKAEFSKFASKTLGYMGEHLLLKIFYQLSKDKSVQEISYFVKCLPQNNPQQKSFVETAGLLRNESVLYNGLIQKIQHNVNIQFCPNTFYSKPDIIIMENLQIKKFTISKEIYLNDKKIKSGLKTIATMHAGYLALEELDENCLSKDCRAVLNECKFNFTEGHTRNKWYFASVKCVVDLCIYFSGNSDYRCRIMNYFRNILPNIIHWNITRNVLCHNDLWKNNILFNNLDDCIIVDFQLALFGPPVIDFWWFLYFNCDNSTINLKLEEFSDYYYQALEKTLNETGLDASKLFPKKNFKESLKIYAKPCLLQVCAASTYIFASDDFVKKMMMDNEKLYNEFNFGNRSQYIRKFIEESKECKSKFENLILPLCEMFSHQ